MPRNAHTPTPAAAQALNGAAAQQQANMEKRGPVEFNHAISYVNKIKASNFYANYRRPFDFFGITDVLFPCKWQRHHRFKKTVH